MDAGTKDGSPTLGRRGWGVQAGISFHEDRRGRAAGDDSGHWGYFADELFCADGGRV